MLAVDWRANDWKIDFGFRREIIIVLDGHRTPHHHPISYCYCRLENVFRAALEAWSDDIPKWKLIVIIFWLMKRIWPSDVLIESKWAIEKHDRIRKNPINISYLYEVFIYVHSLSLDGSFGINITYVRADLSFSGFATFDWVL